MAATTSWGTNGLPTARRVTAGSTTLTERRYRWDESGRLVGVQVRDRLGTRRVVHDFDYLGRLRRSTRGGGDDVAYALDATGNRTLVRRGTAEDRYRMQGDDAVGNRYTTTPAGRRTYDGNGNLLTETDEQGRRRTMRYDYLNRMVQLVDGSGQVTSYGYDCLGRRLVKTGPAGSVRLVWDGDAIIEEQGAAMRSLVRHGTAVFGAVTEEGERWFATDLRGSVTDEIDDTGAVVATHEYGDYGEAKDGAALPLVSYSGYPFDVESGWYYARHRYLEPRTGRFTTRDPAGVWEDGRNRGNAYAYVGNNPTTFVDPTGESTNTWYSCGGPWPGPRTIKVEYEGCSKARRDLMITPVCRAFRAAGQSADRLLALWINDVTGIPSAGAETTRSRVKRWFGGPDNATSTNSKSIIYATLDDVYDAIIDDDFDIDCEGGSGSCPGGGTNAYVNWGGSDVNLTNRFFNCFGRSKQAAILIHELTHAYNDTDDYFYYKNDGVNLPENSLFETPVLRENADTYEQFTLEFFLP